MNMQTSQVGPRPGDIPPEVARKILSFINTSSTTEEIVNSIISPMGKSIVSIRIAQKILHTRAKLGGFKDLKQLKLVPRIGNKTFAGIMIALTSDKESQ